MWTAAPDGETPELETDEACSVAPTRDNLIKRVRKFLVGCDMLDLFPRHHVFSCVAKELTKLTKILSDADMELSLDLVVVCT